MKRLAKCAVWLVLAAAVCFLSVTRAASAAEFIYTVGDPDNGAGAKFTVKTNDDGTARLILKSVSTGDAETYDLVLPDTVTHEGTTYTVTAFGSGDVAVPTSLAPKISSITFGEHLREVSGNLFNFQKYTSGANPLNTCSGPEDHPDSAALLSGIPAFITDHYDSDGAYYAGKCLVRLKPDYAGDYTVKDGTICVLAGAFEGCEKLGEVKLPSSVEFIGMRAFANSSVTKVNLPSGLTEHSNEIYMQTFFGCTKLKTVTFDSGCKLGQICRQAFMNCSALTGFDFSKVSYLQMLCFAGAFDPDVAPTVTVSLDQMGYGHYGVFAGSGIGKVVFTEGSANWLPMEAFCNCTKLTAVTLSSNVQKISLGAFNGCTALTSDVLGQANCKVLSLEWLAFANTGLKSITIPATVTSVSPGTFNGCKDLKTLIWKAGSCSSAPPLFSVLQAGIAGYSNTWGGNLPDTAGKTFITKLQIDAWPSLQQGFCAQQPYLETLDIGAGVTSLPENAFLYCPSLKTVNIAATGSMGGNAFLYSGTAESTLTATGLKTLEEKALLYSRFKTVNLTAVETVNYAAFMHCGNLTTVSLPALKTISKGSYISALLFYGCPKLQSVDLGNAEVIPRETFLNCGNDSSLETATTLKADKVKTVEENGFLESPFAVISLPLAETVGHGAFMQSSKLTTVSLPAL